MSKIDETDIIWKELRIVILAYAGLNIGYALFLYWVYGQQPSQDWPTLLQGVGELLFGRNKANIFATAVYVFLTTLPLAVSSFFAYFIIERQSSLWIYLTALAIILPFTTYFYVVDRPALFQVVTSATPKKCHIEFDSKPNIPSLIPPGHLTPWPPSTVPNFRDVCDSPAWPSLWEPSTWPSIWLLILEIFKFYFFKYKFPLTVGSIFLGVWAAYRLSESS